MNPYAAPQSVVVPADDGQQMMFCGWAGFWRRFAALVLDMAIVITVAAFFGEVVGRVVGVAGGVGPDRQLPAGLTVGLQIVGDHFQLLSFALLESSSLQATLGKMALGIKVTDLHGPRISFLRALCRYFAKILSCLTLGLGFLTAASTKRKQCLHDQVVGALVVKTR